MSISPPSDIVLDVARAADPTRYSQAAARLTRAQPSADAFADFLGDLPEATTASGAAIVPPALQASGPPPQKAPANAAEAYQNFEAMTLSTMIEASMPDNETAVFGSGTAGSVWKSMLAEQLGAQMAKRGGIGLATQLARSSQAEFGGDAASRATAGQQAKTLLVANIERGLFKELMPGTGETTTETDTYATKTDSVF
jgi:Rod binding domain-containing protein